MNGDQRSEPAPRDSLITIYGRKPVLETLSDRSLVIEQVLMARSATGASAQAIAALAAERGVPVRRLAPEQVSRISRRPKQDQGVVADVAAPRMASLSRFLQQTTSAAHRVGRPPAPQRLLVLDGVSNPANVGMIIRTAAAAGLEGIVLPRQRVPGVGPLVIKASAGIAFKAPILRAESTESALELLQEAGFMLFGLSGEAPLSYFQADFPAYAAFVLGGETEGVGEAAGRWIHQWISLPMASGVESLNVASTAAALAYELVRRQATAVPAPGRPPPVRRDDHR